MMSMETSSSNRNNDADTDPSTQPSPDLQNLTNPRDPENPQQAADSRCMANTIKFGKLLAYLILAMAAAAVIAALGVLTLPVSAALLLVFAVTYSFINIAPFARYQKDNERYKEFTTRLAISTVTVALVLLLSLIVVFVVFRVHSSLKHGAIAGLGTWKWLLIALVSCVFCNIWVGGRFILTLVQEEYDYREELIYFTGKLRRAINCICFIVGEIIVLRVAPHSKRSIIILGLALWKWIMVLVSLLCGLYLIQVTTYLLVLSLEAWQNKFWKESYDGNRNKDGKRPKANKRHTIKKYAVFMAKGLRTRINILLFFLLILLTWIFYIKPRLRLEESAEYAKKAVHFAIRTFLSLLIVAVLSLIKKYLLLLWEARELYRRFKTRIIETYTQLFYLAKICGSEWELFNNWWTKAADSQGGCTRGDEPSPKGGCTRGDEPSPKDGISVTSTDQGAGSARSTMSVDQGAGSARLTGQRSVTSTDQGAGSARSTTSTDQGAGSARLTGKRLVPSAGNASGGKRKDKNVRMDEDAKVKLQQILDSANAKFVSYDILKRIAKLFLNAQYDLASNRVEKLCLQWEENQEDPNSKMDQDELIKSIDQVYEYKFEEKDATCLYQQLEAYLDKKRDVQYKDFENWMKAAHENCTQLGNILAGAQEAVAYLNKIMIGFLIVVCIVIWLFLTNIATTQLIVLLTSPFLAATFIFGDMAKTVFQGIIFAFAVHPFDVGDMCVIQEHQLEVKKIGIWKTTFYKNGNKDEEVMYPNSTLITTSIHKHKKNLDLHDSVEFNVQLGLSDYETEDEALNTLMKKISDHLEHNIDFERGSHHVLVKDIDEDVKMEVQFRHKKNVQHMTYLECLKKKNESRSKLLQEIRKLIHAVGKEYEQKITRQQDGDIGEPQACINEECSSSG